MTASEPQPKTQSKAEPEQQPNIQPTAAPKPQWNTRPATEPEQEKGLTPAKETESFGEERTAKEAGSERKKTYEEMTIEELQQAILDRMAMNGPVTDRMRQDVIENVYHNSLINWIKSFR